MLPCCLLMTVGCGDPSPFTPTPLDLPSVTRDDLQPNAFTVLSYHLGTTGAAHQEVRQDFIHTVSEEYPDILALQGVAHEDGLVTLRDAFTAEGLSYPHARLLQNGTGGNTLAVLSRHPIVLQTMRTNDSYSIEGTPRSVQCGFLDASIVVDGHFLLRLFIADLVGKDYHPLGQAEMRRNEARLLAQHLRRALKDQPNQHILVACSMSDISDSAAFREITSKKTSDLIALEPRDDKGNGWTFFVGKNGGYVTHDFFFVTHELETRLEAGGTRVVHEVGVAENSPYRPLLTTVRHRDPEPGS